MSQTSRRAFGAFFALGGLALILAHLFHPMLPRAPAAEGHDILILGVAGIVAGAWFWDHAETPRLFSFTRDDALGMLFFLVGAALLGHNWWFHLLENKSTLLGVMMMVAAAHYLSMEKSARMVRSMIRALPILRRRSEETPPKDEGGPEA